MPITTIPSSGTTDGTNLVLLNSQTASSVATVNYDNTLITSSYDTYILYGFNVTNNSNQTQYVHRFSINNGSSFITCDHGRQYTQVDGGNAEGAEGSRGTDEPVFAPNLGNDTNESHFIKFELTNVNSTDQFKFCSTHMHGMRETTTSFLWIGSTQIRTTSALNYFQVKVASGSLSGTFKLYGVRS